MRESPAGYRERTGRLPRVADPSAARSAPITVPRPLGEGETCPTLYRDPGPQALGLFHQGALRELAGPGASCVFLRDAAPVPHEVPEHGFGMLVVLEPLAMGPWFSGHAGVYIAERERMPAPGTLGLVPPGESLPELDEKLDDVRELRALREILGGGAYDERVRDAARAVRQYLEDWQVVERHSAPLRAVLLGPVSAAGRS